MVTPVPGSSPLHAASKPEIDLFLRALYTLLRSSGEVQLRALSESYASMDSSLHVGLHASTPDLACWTYCVFRLPDCIAQTAHVLLGQTDETFRRQGFVQLEQWTPVESPARRRKMRFDGNATLAVYIASPSDIDDLAPTLLAYELEWNKLHARLVEQAASLTALQVLAAGGAITDEQHADLLKAIGVDEAGWRRLKALWPDQYPQQLLAIASARKHFGLRLLGGSANDFRRALHVWWRHLESASGRDDFDVRPVYFVSSNMHAMVNLVNGFARTHEREIVHAAERTADEEVSQLLTVRDKATGALDANVLYYLLRRSLRDGNRRHLAAAKSAAETALGIASVQARDALSVDAQVFELSRLNTEQFDPRIGMPGLSWLRASDALVINVDYPLGFAAYQLLHTVSYHTSSLLGLYVMGKAATLNGRVGDVMIAHEFSDEHSGNRYLVNNCFIAEDVAPFLLHGTAIDHQQAISVRGTFLQNHRYLDELYTAGCTVVEMEAGPYLDALYESTFLSRYPVGQVINLYGAPCDAGFIYYASDTPFSHGHNLGEKSLSFYGMDATYASAVAVLRRIFDLELQRLRTQRDGWTPQQQRRLTTPPPLVEPG